MRVLTLMMMCWFIPVVNASTWYVDSSAAGTRNGTSWADAWTSVTQISGVSAGDTVYISGGPTGSTRIYSLNNPWAPSGGISGKAITYQIGQDASHNGTAIFNSPGNWIAGALKNVVISGDAGDGKMHFQLNNIGGAAVGGSGSQNFRFSYVNCGQKKSAGWYFNTGEGIEIDHCYYYKLVGTDDTIIYLISRTGTWDTNKIHDNEFHKPHSNTNDGHGDDCFVGQQWTGVSFYNNKVIDYSTDYRINGAEGGQHGDGIQPLMCTYVKCYNNYFENIPNYPVYGDAYYGDFVHVFVYNNIIVITDPGVQNSDSPQGIAIGGEGSTKNFRDVMIANNLIVDYAFHAAINLRNNPGQSNVFSQCSVVNNISLNSGGFGTERPVSTGANIRLNLRNGSGHFVRYTPLQRNNDFHLLATDRTFRGKGTNISSYFSTDKDGNARPKGTAWDIGPYEFETGSSTKLR